MLNLELLRKYQLLLLFLILINLIDGAITFHLISVLARQTATFGPAMMEISKLFVVKTLLVLVISATYLLQRILYKTHCGKFVMGLLGSTTLLYTVLVGCNAYTATFL